MLIEERAIREHVVNGIDSVKQLLTSIHIEQYALKKASEEQIITPREMKGTVRKEYGGMG